MRLPLSSARQPQSTSLCKSGTLNDALNDALNDMLNDMLNDALNGERVCGRLWVRPSQCVSPDAWGCTCDDVALALALC